MSVPPTGQSYVKTSGEYSSQEYRAKVSDIVVGNLGVTVEQPPLPTKFFNVPTEEWLNSPDQRVPGKNNWETHQLVLMNRFNDVGSPEGKKPIWILSRKK